MKSCKISFKKIVSLLILLTLSLSILSSCVGESAYDIAVRNGFEGSEEEWLESLVGKDGSDGEDGRDGLDGKDGLDGENGKDGKDGASAQGDVAKASAVAIRSALSIFCTFERYQYPGWGRDPIISEYTGGGAGVIYKLDKERGDAYIITNYHVVYDEDSISSGGISNDITMYLYGLQYKEMEIKAEFVGGSATYDLAILKVSDSEILKSANVSEITLANSDEVAVGELAVAIGNPESEGISVTSGIISVDSEYVKMNPENGNGSTEMRLMRIDTPINHGNSGGGLFDGEGKLIGIVNAKLESAEIENIGYAIPSNIAYAVAENVIKNYENSSRSGLYRATLGVVAKSENVRTVYDADRSRTYIKEDVIISSVAALSAAEGALKVGDRLVAVSCNGVSRNINRRFSIIEFVMSLCANDEVEFTVVRDGETVSVKILLDESVFSRVA